MDRDKIEQIISAWAFAHNIDGAARNDLFARIRSTGSAEGEEDMVRDLCSHGGTCEQNLADFDGAFCTNRSILATGRGGAKPA